MAACSTWTSASTRTRSVVLGARYTFKPGMSAGIHLNSGDIDYWTLSVRWEL